MVMQRQIIMALLFLAVSDKVNKYSLNNTVVLKSKSILAFLMAITSPML